MLQEYSPITIGLNFAGTTSFESSLNPSDTHGAVGLEHIVELNNGQYKVYDKDTGAEVQSSTINQFWLDAGVNILPDEFTFDPRVLYDPFSDRWFAAGAYLLSNDDTPFLVAVSNDSDPTQGWTGFEIDPVFEDVDYPTLGLNSEGVFISSTNDSDGEVTGAIVVLPKTDLINGTVKNATLFEGQDGVLGIFQPVVDLDNTGQPHSLYTSFSDDLFKRVIVSGPIEDPTLDRIGGPIVDETTGIGGFVEVDEFLDVQNLGGAFQPGTNTTLDTLNSRLKTSLVLQNGAIWGVQDVNANRRPAVRWFQIDAETNELLQEGQIADPKLDFYYGAIAVNDYDDVVIGFNGSGETQFVSSFAVVGDTVGGETTFSEPVLLKESTVSYVEGPGEGFAGPDSIRWADYSATVVDPVDPYTFWTFQTLALEQDEWSTQITEIKIPGIIPVTDTIEAEDLELNNYLVEKNNFASGGALIGLKGSPEDTGTASTTFKGQSGLYDIVVGYFDEADGEALLRFRVNDDSVDKWSLNQNLGSNVADDKSFQQRTISEVELTTGDTLAIEGLSDGNEFARVDYLTLLPRNVFDVDSDPIAAVSETGTIM